MSQRKWGRAIGALMAVTLASAGLLVALAPAADAAPTGASAVKDCPTATPPAFYTIGSVVTCTAIFTNTGATTALVDGETEEAPFISNGNPGNGPFTNISCLTATNLTISLGSLLPPNTACTATFNVTIPMDPTLCNSFFRDRVEIDLEYPGTGPPPLTADAGATNTFAVVCPPKIAVTKTATPLSKPTDPVTYTIQVCNTGFITVTKQSVMDSLLGDISADFPATLAPGACATDTLTRTVLASDPNPLVNTVTATYTGGPGPMTDTETATAHTDLFYPSVSVTKSCGPNPIQIGQPELCHIVVTNTSTGTTPPALHPVSISDSLNGDLLAANPAVVNTTCNADLPTGGSCTINTARAVLNTDPNPLVNTVTVHYNPVGFPNDITANAQANVTIVHPAITITKTATPLSKPGDVVTYTLNVCNTGPVDVTRTSVTDTLLGDITADFPATLASGACSGPITEQRTVLASDPNPLPNTVTAVYSGIGESSTATASASTDLFYPSVSVTKSCGPDPIEVGQPELCHIVVTNTSTGTTPPALNPASINDTLNGDLLNPSNTAVVNSTCGAPLPTGASCTINTTRTVLGSDPTPLVNTVSVLYHPDGFPNNITAQASASVNIVTPGISVNITATPLSKPTDNVHYVITVCDTGNEAEALTSVIATVLGNETALFPASLAAGQCVSASVDRTVLASDPNPLVVSVTADATGIQQTASASSTASTDLFFPSVGVTKSCGPSPIAVGQAEVCTITVTNTSTGTTPPALVNGTINDTLNGDLLAAGNPAVTASTCTATLATGASCQITTSRVVLATDPSPLSNTVAVHYNPDGFPNNITASATASVTIQVLTQQCTLGFWKQAQHFHFWVGFTPNEKFSAVFGVTITLKANGSTPAITDPTLLQALNAGGGGINSLARHAVAALLNSSSLQSPTFTTAQVIAMVDAAIAAGPTAIAALAAQLDAEQQADNCMGFINT